MTGMKKYRLPDDKAKKYLGTYTRNLWDLNEFLPPEIKFVEGTLYITKGKGAEYEAVRIFSVTYEFMPNDDILEVYIPELLPHVADLIRGAEQKKLDKLKRLEEARALEETEKQKKVKRELQEKAARRISVIEDFVAEHNINGVDMRAARMRVREQVSNQYS